MDYPKILQKQKNPYRFFIKSFFYIEGKNSDFAQRKIVPKMRQDVKAKKILKIRVVVQTAKKNPF